MEFRLTLLCAFVVTGSSTNINSFIESKTLFSFTGPLNTKIIDSIAAGVQLAMDQCSRDFKWEKWNCPESSFSKYSSSLATKEQAYSKAILAAGIVYSITKNCSRGEIDNCGCDPIKIGPKLNYTKDDWEISNLEATKKGRDWIWGGCSDDVSYGNKIAKIFLDGMEKANDIYASVAKHNYHIGRKVVQNSLTKKCQCHGMFCPLQTCWTQLIPFEEISRKLKNKYKKGVNPSESTTVYSSNNFRRNLSSIPAGYDDFLLFLEKSPDYCVPNAIKNWPGTKGRHCSRNRSKDSDLSERRSCKHICRACGHSVTKIKKTIVKRCNCHFRWCCDVKCDICEEEIEEFVCT